MDYGVSDHRNCKDNLYEALAEHGVRPPVTPEVVNLFQNSGADAEGKLCIEEPLSGAGDYVVLRALADLLVAVSACPQDLNPANGFVPTDLLLQVYAAHGSTGSP